MCTLYMYQKLWRMEIPLRIRCKLYGGRLFVRVTHSLIEQFLWVSFSLHARTTHVPAVVLSVSAVQSVPIVLVHFALLHVIDAWWECWLSVLPVSESGRRTLRTILWNFLMRTDYVTVCYITSYARSHLTGLWIFLMDAVAVLLSIGAVWESQLLQIKQS